MADSSSWPARSAAGAVLLVLLGPLLAYLEAVPAMTGFLLFGLGGVTALLTLLASVVVAVRRGLAQSRTGLLVATGVLAILVLAAWPGRKVPRINDISTDLAAPPRFLYAGTLPANQGRSMDYPGEEFARQQARGYPDLGPLALTVPVDEAFRRVESTARAFPGWEVTRVDPVGHAVEGVATTRLFRFRDDFVIEVRPGPAGAIVHMRSKSRDGKGDVGANAARIEGFFARLK